METTRDPRRGGEAAGVRLGLRAVLLLLAVVLFVLAVILDENAFDVAAIGWAALAGAFLVGELGLDRR